MTNEKEKVDALMKYIDTVVKSSSTDEEVLTTVRAAIETLTALRLILTTTDNFIERWNKDHEGSSGDKEDGNNV